MQATTALARMPWGLQEKTLIQLAVPLATFAAALLAVLFVRRMLFAWIRRKGTGPAPFLPVFLDTIRAPSIFWALAAAVAIALHFTELSSKQIQWAGLAIVVFLIASLTLAAASIAVRMIAEYGERQGMPFAAAGLSRTLVRVLILLIGAMTLMGYLGVPITPLITALGVGGLAVALALQDTLANFFAGIHILVEQPIFVGDYIRLSEGDEGTVTDIGWRTTRVLTGANNTIVIPNTKITSSILVNFSLPDRRVAVEIPIVTAHEADPEVVRRLALEVATGAAKVLPEPAPLVLFDPGVTPAHLQCKLVVNVANRLEQGPVQSEIRLRLLQRFREEGVPLPPAGRFAPRGY